MIENPSPITLRVVDTDEEADGVKSLRLARPGGGELPPWSPGAHIDLHLGGGMVRQYSLCGAVTDVDSWRIAVLRDPDSRGGSIRIHEGLAVGDEIEVSGPRNNFPLVPAEEYLFIAGGIGITPLLPMIEAAATAGASWRLLYGGRNRASMAFVSELHCYGEAVTLAPQDEVGLLNVARVVADTRPRAHVYACGPEPLVAAVKTACAARAPETVHFERFTATPAIPRDDETAFEVELHRSRLVISVPPRSSIVDVLGEAGVDVATVCKEGICGSCETRVLAGVPDHRDSVLTDAEKATGESMMICVTRALSPRLVLDL